MIKMMIGAAGASAFAACLLRSEYEKNRLSVERTEIISDKIKEDKRICFLTDLHSKEFGKGNQRLLKAIDEIKPDAVLSGGDVMVTKKRADCAVALELFRELTKKYPVYCGNGNHETRMRDKKEVYGDAYKRYKRALKDMGVVFLENETAPFGSDCDITGMELEEAYYKDVFCRKDPKMKQGYLEKQVKLPKEDRFHILLVHSPLYLKEYAGWGADLALSGHFHGGTIRLPFFGGVMTPQYQFFHPLCEGTFREGSTWMIAGRGLGTHSVNIRFNDLPQIVVVELKAKEKSGRS